MKRQSTKGMRLLPLCLVMSIGFFSIPSLFRGFSSEVNATVTNPAPPHYEYTINGREYKENGIIYDIPKADDPSRDAEVVIFPNRAVIPSYVTVDGVQYTVRKIRSSAPPDIAFGSQGLGNLASHPEILQPDEGSCSARIRLRRLSWNSGFLWSLQYQCHECGFIPEYGFFPSVRQLGLYE